MVQQIHSLRASGVMSSQAASAFASAASAFRRSGGRLCTTTAEIRRVVIGSSRRLKDQASDARVQLGFWAYRGSLGRNPNFGRCPVEWLSGGGNRGGDPAGATGRAEPFELPHVHGQAARV